MGMKISGKVRLPKVTKTAKKETSTAKMVRPRKRSKDAGKKQRKFSFSNKLLVLFGVPLIIIGVTVASLSTVTLRNNLYTEIQSGLHLAAVSLETTYSKLYDGDYSRTQSGALYKGDVQISGDSTLLDSLREKADVETAFCFDDRIVLTTLRMVTGARAVGLQLDADICERVKAGETVFDPAYELQGVQYFGYFLPLQNEDGSVVGAIFAGKTVEQVSRQVNQAMIQILAPTMCVMLVFLLCVFFFAKYLTKNMKKTRRFLEKVSEGDLVIEGNEKRVKSTDEIGDIYEISVHLRNELRNIVSNIKASGDTMTVSATELMDMSRHMRKNAGQLHNSLESIRGEMTNQAGQTEESADNIYKIGTQIESISDEMNSMYETVHVMSDAEKKSNQLMQELNVSNEEMVTITNEIARQIDATDASVQSIQQTIDIIHDIADETNLLSINASIEAAHAGASGRGFAVIAEQINKLASMSAENAKNVEDALAALKADSQSVVVTMSEVTRRVDSQNEKLTESMSNFEAVARGVESSQEVVGRISQRVEELHQAKESVLACVTVLSEVAEKLVESTGPIADTAGEMENRMRFLEDTAKKLEAVSEKLNSGLDIFKL